MSLNKITLRITTVLFVLSSLVFTMLFSVFTNAYDKQFYVKEYRKYNLSEYVEMNEYDYYYGIAQLIDYCQGKVDSIQTSATIDGKYSETLYNQREIDHMVDVKNLAQTVEVVQNISFLISLVSMIVLVLSKSKNNFDTYWKTSKVTYLLIIGTILGLLMMIFTNFDSFWTSFHHVFFPGNDLWLLNPATDRMIRMLPGELFNDLVLNIVGMFILMYTIVCGVIYLIMKEKGNYLYD